MAEIENIYKKYLANPTICTDTRDIKDGSMFFALKGENFDANSFALQALEKGASFAIVDDKALPMHEQLILVDNVLETLQELARFHRNQFNIPFIGITGTNGKTTTKELMHAVLSKKYNVLATVGNFNNHIGVPLTLLRLNKSHEIAIIEMGANHVGEIEFLCNIADPDYGIITNIGKAHLEGFGSYEGVKKAKTELYRHIQSKSGTLFVNSSDPVLLYESQGVDRILYGDGSNYIGKYENSNEGKIILQATHLKKTLKIRTQLFGSYNFDNLMGAFVVGKYFKVENDDLRNAIIEYKPNNSRSQVINTKSNVIILDAYNANPSSMELALNSFNSMEGSKKIVILGDMLELGEDEDKEHKKVITFLRTLNFHRVFLVGENFSRFKEKDFNTFMNVEDLNNYLEANPIENSQILIKGSRALMLEKVLDIIS